MLTGHVPATRNWERADQDLLELFASEVGVALRNAELFGRIESQNAQLRELDAAKDEFLRGVSHNLQTPLTSIRAYVEQLRATTDGRRDGPPPGDRGRAVGPSDAAGPPAPDRHPPRGRRAARRARGDRHGAARPARLGGAQRDRGRPSS